MFNECSLMLLLGILVVVAECLTTGLMEDVSKADQAMRPKAKRVQELLMFGNQQNRRAENVAAAAAANTYTPNTEKRTLGTSGLEDVKAALSEGETFGYPKQPYTPSEIRNPIYDREELLPYEKNYEYGKVLANDISPRNWNVPPYPRYYSVGDDRRKRSDKPIAAHVSSTTLNPSSSSLPTTQATPEPVAQAKRSIPVYQEPRYKRALDREDFLTLLSLWENSPRNRNWRNYANDEYENVEDDAGVVGLDEEDPRNDGAWMAVEPPRHFSTSMHGPQPISTFDIGIPRTHPVTSYDQYESQYGAPYEGTQYGAAQYGALYPSQSYYQPEKRFVVARKRSQGYETYAGRNDLASLSRLMGSQPQVYPNYPHRLIY